MQQKQRFWDSILSLWAVNLSPSNRTGFGRPMAMAMMSVQPCASLQQMISVPATEGSCVARTHALMPVCFSKSALNLSRSRGKFELLRSSGGAARRREFPVLVTATLTVDEAPAKADLSGLKSELLAAVAGLDRGLVANDGDDLVANSAAVKLEAAGDALELPEDLDKLQGRWRLIYSSGFATRSLGGQRPGPSITRLPFTIGLIYQRIDVASRELDNIVDLRLPSPWPLPPLQITATLAHSFELAGGAKLRILFEKTIVKPSGSISQFPPFELPQIPEFIRPKNDSNGTGSGEFDTTYLDKDLRISRGDRGELRIFVRA